MFDPASAAPADAALAMSDADEAPRRHARRAGRGRGALAGGVRGDRAERGGLSAARSRFLAASLHVAARSVIYGVLLALAAVGLEWLRFRHVTRIDSTEIYLAILAIGFIALGIWVGRKLTPQPRPLRIQRNDAAIRSLGLTDAGVRDPRPARLRPVQQGAGPHLRHLAQYGEDPSRPRVRETGGAEPDAGGGKSALAGPDSLKSPIRAMAGRRAGLDRSRPIRGGRMRYALIYGLLSARSSWP